MINLPIKSTSDSARATKLFFEKYGSQQVNFNANDVYNILGFFQYKGFQDDAAILTGLAVLAKAKQENTDVYTIIESLKTVDGVQLSILVSRILNQDRPATSSLGYKTPILAPSLITRNILP